MNNGKTEIIYEGLGFRDEAAYGGRFVLLRRELALRAFLLLGFIPSD